MQIISTLLGNHWWLFNPPVICKYLKIVASYLFDLNPPDLYSINSIDKLSKKKTNKMKWSTEKKTSWDGLLKGDRFESLRMLLAKFYSIT